MRVRAIRRLAPAIAVAALAAIMSVAPRAVQAQSTWVGGNGTSWATPNNWTPSGEPASTATATFGASGYGTVTIPSSTSIGEIDFTTGGTNYSFAGGPLALTSTGILDSSAATITFAGGPITGAGGVTQSGAGTLILSGADTFTGATSVTAGTLQIDGNTIASAITINGGTLNGTGTVGPVSMGLGALVPGTPGDPTGTLTVNGGLTMSAVGDTEITLGAAGNSTINSTINVVGNAAVAGIVNLIAAPGETYSTADTFTIVNATGVVRQNFAGFTVSGSFGNVAPYLIYNNTTGSANSVVVGLTAGTAWLGGTATNGEYLWSSTANWAGGALPYSPGSPFYTTAPALTVASFGGLANPAITINSAATVGTMLFTSGVSAPYAFAINGGGTLILGSTSGNGVGIGLGIDDNSLHPPQFTVGGSAVGAGTLEIEQAATAADAVIVNNSGGTTIFGTTITGIDTASAGTANITTNSGGVTLFEGRTTGGFATITTNSGGTTTFEGNSTAGNAVLIINTGGIVQFTGSGIVEPNMPPSGSNSVSAGAIEGAGQLELNGETLTINAGIAGTTFSGVISGNDNGSLTIAGGTTTLTGANTYAGATTIDGGTLAVNGAGTIAPSSGVTVNSTGTLTGNGTVPGVTVNAGGTLVPGASGAGTLTIDGNLTLAAGSNYAATLAASGSNTSSTVSGTAAVDGIITAVAGGGTYSASDTYTILSAAKGVTDAASGLTISGSFGNLVPYVATGSSTTLTLGLTGGNVWTGAGGGATWSTGGNWTSDSVPVAGTGAASVAAFTSNAAPTTIGVTGGAVAGTLLFYSGAPAYNFTISGSGNSLTLNGIGVVDNSGNPPTFNVSSSGTLTFAGAATAGDAAINAASGGTITFTGNSNGGSAQFDLTGGTVNFAGTSGLNSNKAVTAGSIQGTSGEVELGANTLTLTAATGSFTGTLGAVGDTGGLTIGAGAQTLSDVTGNYTGATTVNSGATLTLAGGTTLATGIVVDNGTFGISGNGATSISGLSGSNANASVLLGANTLTITNGTAGSSFAGVISGTGGLTVTGGVETLTGANTYSGATTVSGGQLVLGAANAIEDTTGVTINGGTLGLGGYAQTFAPSVTTIALSNNGTIEGGSLGGAITISSTGGTVNDIGGGVAVTASSGTTTLGGANTYSGATTIASGATLAGGIANALSANSAVTINGTGILDLGSNNQTILALNDDGSGNGKVTNLTNPTGLTGANTAVLTIDGGTGTFTGVISNGSATGVTDTTALTVAAGEQTLSGTNTYTGATTVGVTPVAGTPTVSATLTVLGSIATSSGVTVNAGGILGGFGNGTTTGIVPSVTVNSGGTLEPGNGSAPTAVQTLTLAPNANLILKAGADYSVAVNGADYTATSLTGNGTASLNGIFTVNATAGTYTASETYQVLATAAANGVSGQFSGLTTGGAAFATSNPNVDLVPYLIYNANNVQLGLTAGTIWLGASPTGGNFEWGTGANWNGGTAPTGGFTSGAANVATFTNNGAASTVTVNSSATAGTLLFQPGAPAYTFNINGGGSLALNGIGIDDNSGGHAPIFNVGGSGSGTLQFQNAATAGDATINTNSGGLTQFQNYSNPGNAQFVTAAGGTVDFSGTLGPSGNGAITANSIAGAGAFNLGADQLTIDQSTNTTVSGVIANCNPSTPCAGNSLGSTGGSLVMAGTGTLTLGGANTYSGGTTLDNGVVAVTASTNYNTAGTPSSGILNSPLGTGTLTLNGGTLQAGAAGLSIGNAAQITASGGIIDANGKIFTYAGNITDATTSFGGPLTIKSSTGSGTVIFSGVNTYTGETFVGAFGTTATLQGGAADAFSSESAVNVSSTGTLDVNGFNQAIGGLSGSGTVTNGGTVSNPTAGTAATLTVDGGEGTFSGTIQPGGSGTISLAVVGSGTSLTLNNATADYTGATTIGPGATLALSGSTSIATSSGVVDNGTFSISAGGATTITALSGTNTGADVVLGANTLTISGGSTANPYYGAFTGSGGLTVGAGGALALFGASPSYSGTTTIDSGATLQLGANGALGTGGLTFAGGSTAQETLQAGANNLSFSNSVTLNNSTDTFDSNGNTLTWGGVITGGGDLSVISSVGSGMLVLTGANTYSGATNIDSGTLQVNGSIAGTGVNVNSGGTLSGNGTVNPAVTVNAGGTLSPGSAGNPTGTLTINGNLTFNAGSTYAVTLNNASSSETIVGGNANLAGGTLTIGGTASSTSTTYILLSAGSLTGKFSSLNITGNFGNDLPTVTYSGGNVDLNLVVASTLWQGATSSAWSTATNWSPNNIPGAGTIAAFDDTATSKTITISTTATAGTLLFNANAPAFTFNINSGSSLTLNGNGVVDQSTSTTPIFNIANTGDMAFTGSSSGGNAQYNVASGGLLDFSGSSGNSQLSAGSISGAGTVNLGTNELAVGGNNLSTTFGGVIEGAGGSINKVGTGTLVLSGTNIYTGGTTITAGILQVTNGSSIGTPGDGTLTFNGGTFQSNGKTLSFSNAITVNGGGGTFDSFGNTLTMSGAIAGTGTLTVADSVGGGTLVLSNPGTSSYSGAFTVNSGTLEADSVFSSVSGVTVNGGTLSGTGTLGTTSSAVTVNGGILSPGSIATPTGTLTINGNLNLAAASFYMVSINGAPNSNSLTNVPNGTATVNGATLLLSSTYNTLTINQAYTIISAKTVSGTLNTQAAYASNAGPVQATVANKGTSLTATFAPAQLSAASLPPGYGSFANAINALSNSGKLSNNFVGLFNNPAASAPGLSGISNSGAVPAWTGMQNSFATTLLDRNMGLPAGTQGGSPFGPALGFAPDSPAAPQTQAAYDAVTPHQPLDALMRSLNTPHDYSVWGSVYGGIGSFTGNSNTGSLSTSTSGVGIASGIDYRWGPDTVVGFALGGGYTSWNLSNGLGGGNSDMFQAGFYGSHRFGDFYLSGTLAYALDEMNTNRNVVSPSPANLTANIDGNGVTGRLEGGYRIGGSDANVTPYLATNISALRLPSYSENTASGTPGFALSYAAQTVTNERGEIGLWGNLTFNMRNDALMHFGVKLGYAHDWWSDDSFNALFLSLPTQGFALTGVTPPSNLGLASLLSEISYANGFSFGVKVDGEYGLGGRDYTLAGTGTLRYRW